MGKVDQFNRLVKSFDRYWSEDGDSRIGLGLTTKLDDFGDPTLASQDHCLERSKKMLSRARSLDKKGLNFDQKLDLDLMIHALEEDIHLSTYQIDGKTNLEKMPSGASDVSDGLFRLFMDDGLPAKYRLDVIVKRMENSPAYLKSHLDTLDTPVKRWADIDLEIHDGLPEFFGSLSRWAEEQNYGNMRGLNRAKNKLLSSLDDYRSTLNKMPKTRNFSMGEEYARKQVSTKGIDLSFEELHSMATIFIEETREELDELRRELVAYYHLPKNTTNQSLHSFLNRAYALEMDDILGHYQQERENMVKFLKRNKLFEIPDNQNIKIIQTPKFLEPMLPAGAMDCPLPFRKGTRTSIVYLTINKGTLTEHTKIKIPAMMLHEGIPGHHLHYSTAFNNPSIVRKHLSFSMDQAEGWTTYLEDYLLDQNYMQQWTAETRFVTKLDLMRLGARVAIDLYFMTGNRDYLNIGAKAKMNSRNPFTNAGRLLRKVTGFSPQRVDAELDWYSQSPGYPLSYLAGNKLVWELKDDMAAHMGGKLRRGKELDRLFHKTYLEAGCMPLKYLRKVFEQKRLVAKT
jgi:uncharacterized protein (DUF885 family)